jgi:hypothetical protein
MPWRYTTAAHEARLQSVADLLNASTGATAKLYSSTPTLLAEIELADPIQTAIGTGGDLSLAGTAVLDTNPVSDSSANATGTPATCQFCDSAGNMVLTCGVFEYEAGRETNLGVDTYAAFQATSTGYSVTLTLDALYTYPDELNEESWTFTAVTYSTAALNARLQAVADLLDGGTLEIWSGAIPSTLGDTPAGTLLAELTLPATFAATVSAGVLTSDTIADGTVLADGTPTFLRLKTSGDALIAEGDAGASGLIFDVTDWTTGGTVSVAPLVIRG